MLQTIDNAGETGMRWGSRARRSIGSETDFELMRKKIFPSTAGWPSMGAASGEGVGGRRAPGELQAEPSDTEGADGGVESDEVTGDQIGHGSAAAA